MTLPIFSLVLYGILTVVSFLPAAWNIPVKVTSENKIPVYYLAKNLIIIMKVEPEFKAIDLVGSMTTPLLALLIGAKLLDEESGCVKNCLKRTISC